VWTAAGWRPASIYGKPSIVQKPVFRPGPNLVDNNDPLLEFGACSRPQSDLCRGVSEVPQGLQFRLVLPEILDGLIE